MRSARSSWRFAAAATLCLALWQEQYSTSAFSAQPSSKHGEPLGSATGRGATFLHAARGPAAPETSTRLQPEIEVQDSPANQELDEHSTVVHAARLADGGCEGYLIQKPDHTLEAHISCDSDVDADQFVSVFHKLLLPYLALEYELYEEERDGNIDKSSCQLRVFAGGEMEGSLPKQLDCMGIPSTSTSVPSQSDGLGINLAKYVPFLNEFAFRHRGTEQGITAMHALKMLSRRRVPYDFSSCELNRDIESRSEQSQRSRTVVSHQKQLLPSSEIDKVMEIVEQIKERKWLSDNPDSVDGLPSLHLNLITSGKPLFDRSNDDDGEMTFSGCICDMIDILRPRLYNDLLPVVRKLTNSSTVEISDVFIRNYGKMDEGEGAARYGLSTHYDVQACATCVMTLDSTASTGKNGLYTIPPTPGAGASSHAANRKFFPLKKGDGVVHTYDVLHGVDVDPKLNRPRTSLIVWFTDYGVDGDESVTQPWLLNPTDDIGEFVLGLASESAVEKDGMCDQYSMYLSSAKSGNIFAMTALAQMCIDDQVPDSRYDDLFSVLAGREEHNPFLQRILREGPRSCKAVANALWYHASIQGGHRVAQISLADNLMQQYMSIKDELGPVEQENIILMATTLFTMALAQGPDSQESLDRLMGVECDRLTGMGVEVPSDDFFASPVVQLLLAFR